MKLFYTSILLILFILPSVSFAQSGQEKIKVAYLYKFAQNIEWKGESALSQFNIAYLGDNPETLNILERLATSKTLRDKKINIQEYKEIGDIKKPYPQIIFTGNEQNSLIESIYRKILGKNVLLVSDGSEQQEFVMINFIYPESKISFEVNKKTIIDQKLTILPKLLVLGGSEIDVRELYKKQEAALNAEKQRVAEQKKKLAEQQRNIDKLNSEIETKQAALKKQKKEIELQIEKIKTQNENLVLVQGEVASKEKMLSEKIAELENTKADIEAQQTLIAEQNIKVEEAKENLKKLDIEIAEKQKNIEEKQKAIDKQGTQLKSKDNEIDTQKNYLFVAGAILLLILSLSVFLVKSIIARKKANQELLIKESEIIERNEELLQTNEEINSQKEILDKQKGQLEVEHKSTQDSIRYAQTIQSAILPLKENMDKVIQSFVLFRPKDIVSGDFYWFTNLPAIEGYSEKTFIAAVDCTGHGVPGAFMSMIGSRLLNAIVNEQKITSPAEILTRLDKGVVKSLKQGQTDNNDGMDICLCMIEKQENGGSKVTFTGAKRPLYVYSKKEDSFSILKGDRKSIGGAKATLNTVKFTNQEVLLSKGDLLYLTTDGYADQNDLSRKKIGSVMMENLLNTIKTKPLNAQQKHLEDFLDKHQEGTTQRDDITLIGLKF